MRVPAAFDIFCTVVDNYGDVGVTWRLSRQLVAEHGARVRLWIDHLPSLSRLRPEIDPWQETQELEGVEVRRWTQRFPPTPPGDVVIEAFACELPGTVVDAMSHRQPTPVWINLEYLSAEDWVAGTHGLPSPHPRLPLTKHFFVPGFVERSGGLLRERGLLARRNAFRRNSDSCDALLASLGAQRSEGALLVSLFCYPAAPLPELVHALGGSPLPVTVLAFDGPWLGDVKRSFRSGRLDFHVVPFVTQDMYDQVLWACDLNFVRGEDSFVRALWAGKPFVWAPYRQDQGAHLEKLDAFLAIFEAPGELRDFTRFWNGAGSVRGSWPALASHLPDIAAHARERAAEWARQEDLASRLVKFCAARLK